MARKTRIFVENLSQHVILKSIDALVLFKDAQDYATFLTIVEELLLKHKVAIHAYILMDNYFEFLATPCYDTSLSKFMQSLGRRYVGYYNKKYKRVGTLWEGRYRASLVEDSRYLFQVMSYIERLAPMDYPYSSIGKNLYTQKSAIVSSHQLYKELAYTDTLRAKKYAEFFAVQESDSFIEATLLKQLITGTPEFICHLEKVVGMTLSQRGRGRPKKEIKNQRKKMYKNLVVLDKKQHKELKLSPMQELSFAKDSAFMPVVANEVPLVGAAFPIVFTADAAASLVALVSLGGESLAINAEGKWITSYVPSYLRKYPFSLAGTQENPEQKVVLIDEKSSLFSKSKGKQLFKKDGSQSETLANAINFLTAHENEAVVTANVAKLIADSGILEDREISVGEGDEKKVLVNGFRVVNREKLNALSDDVLADWVRKGIIALIDAHIKSLDNIQALFNIAHQRQN